MTSLILSRSIGTRRNGSYLGHSTLPANRPFSSTLAKYARWPIRAICASSQWSQHAVLAVRGAFAENIQLGISSASRNFARTLSEPKYSRIALRKQEGALSVVAVVA